MVLYIKELHFKINPIFLLIKWVNLNLSEREKVNNYKNLSCLIFKLHDPSGSCSRTLYTNLSLIHNAGGDLYLYLFASFFNFTWQFPFVHRIISFYFTIIYIRLAKYIDTMSTTRRSSPCSADSIVHAAISHIVKINDFCIISICGITLAFIVMDWLIYYNSF